MKLKLLIRLLSHYLRFNYLRFKCHSQSKKNGAESRSVGFEPTTSGFGDPRSTELN